MQHNSITNEQNISLISIGNTMFRKNTDINSLDSLNIEKNNNNNNKNLSKNQGLTHFLSLPITSPQITQSVEIFYQRLKNEYSNISGFDNSILVPPQHLHITLCMLSLKTKKEEEEAQKLLESLSSEVYDIINTTSLMVSVSEITCLKNFKQNSKEVAHVIYAKIKEIGNGNRLVNMSEFLKKKFIDAGFCSQDESEILYHVTLLNTRYRKPSPKKRIPIEVGDILKNFGNIDFGKVKIENVHVSCRFKFHPETKYYQDIAKISLP